MKKLTPTHHRNYFEVEHKTTRRCNPFAYRHHNVLFPNPYAYQRNKVIYLFRLKIGSTTKEGKQSRACISLDNTVTDPANINKHLSTFFSCHLRALSKLSNIYIRTGNDQNNRGAGPEKIAKLNTSRANQGIFLQLS